MKEKQFCVWKEKFIKKKFFCGTKLKKKKNVSKKNKEKFH